MKRRAFIEKGTVGALGMGLSGCSALGLNKVVVKPQGTPMDFDTKVSKPHGTMPMSEIGTTGIKVSKFGFGSHISQELRKYEKEREWMIREAYDLGINLFDVYDIEGNIFQYEPMGRFLAPMINDVVISISMTPYDGRNIEQELERDLRVFGRDYIDLVRIHARNKESERWEHWEKLFKFKEKGYIRAVGLPVHTREDLVEPLAELPLDYVILPFSFYHNWLWGRRIPDKKMHTVVTKLREKGIGVITMKPFAGGSLALPFKRLGKQYDETGEISVAKASLRYIINSGANPDTTLGGMYNPYHVYENVDAYFNPAMSDEERKILRKIRKTAKIVAKDLLPEHYRFLEDWVQDSWDDSDLFDKA